MKSNPFATRFVAPGRLPWLGCDPGYIPRLGQNFESQFRRRAAIIGPHGSGKSSLLRHLSAELGSVCYYSGPACADQAPKPGGNIVWLQLHTGVPAGTTVVASRPHWRPGRILIIDGFEQLSWWSQLLLLSCTRHSRMGLLVTAHRPSRWLPTLVATKVTEDVAVQVVNCLLEQGGTQGEFLRGRATCVGDMLAAHSGNMRELLMALYDEYYIASRIRTGTESIRE